MSAVEDHQKRLADLARETYNMKLEAMNEYHERRYQELFGPKKQEEVIHMDPSERYRLEMIDRALWQRLLKINEELEELTRERHVIAQEHEKIEEELEAAGGKAKQRDNH